MFPSIRNEQQKNWIFRGEEIGEVGRARISPIHRIKRKIVDGDLPSLISDSSTGRNTDRCVGLVSLCSLPVLERSTDGSRRGLECLVRLLLLLLTLERAIDGSRRGLEYLDLLDLVRLLLLTWRLLGLLLPCSAACRCRFRFSLARDFSRIWIFILLLSELLEVTEDQESLLLLDRDDLFMLGSNVI